ncbi:ATP-binding protein [Nocardia sp. NPDC057030]|uniref:ATP-binding protein n=1 Tax=unclassified Nocardia TaxID=2637762 RepID=UPI00363FA457
MKQVGVSDLRSRQPSNVRLGAFRGPVVAAADQIDDYNETRILRLLARFIAVGYLMYFVLLVPHVRNDADYLAPWWTPFALSVVFGPAILLLAATFRPNIGFVRRAAGLCAIGYLVAVLGWPLAWTGTHLPDAPWLVVFPGLAALAATVVWRPFWTVTYFAVIILLVEATGQSRVPEAISPLLSDLAFGFGFSLVFVAAALMAVRTGRTLDETRDMYFATAAAVKVLAIREVEREKFSDLLHDWVSFTLGIAGREPRSDKVRRHAVITLGKLDDIGKEIDTEPIGIDRLLGGLAAAVREVDDAIPVVVRTVDDVGPARFEAEAAKAIVTAAAEAVRNSVRHGGTDARCTTSIEVTPKELVVTVTDVGIGFEPASVGSGYGGQRHLGRIQQLPGGTVEVTSRPGRGTRVRLRVTPRSDIADEQDYARNSPDVRFLLGMHERTAWLVAAIYLTGIAALATIAVTRHLSASVVVAALAGVMAVGAASVGLLAVPGDPLPWPATFALTVGAPAMCALVMLIPPVINDTHQVWVVSGFTGVCTFMCVRGRTGSAWAAMISMIVVAAVWSTLGGLGPGTGFFWTFINCGPLAMATLFAVTIRPAARDIFLLREQRAEQFAIEAATAEAIKEREIQLAHLDELARPLLLRIAGEDAFTIEDALACRVLEAQLRATLRASGLVNSIVNPAAEAARRRGVKVNLLDDNGIDDAGDAVRNRLLRGIAAELDRANTGTMTIRINPPGRQYLATIVARSGVGVRRVSFDQEGRPVNTSVG